MTFRYNMHGFHIGKLSMLQLTASGSTLSVWQRVGKMGDTWKEATVDVSMGEGDRVSVFIPLTFSIWFDDRKTTLHL